MPKTGIQIDILRQYRWMSDGTAGAVNNKLETKGDPSQSGQYSAFSFFGILKEIIAC